MTKQHWLFWWVNTWKNFCCQSPQWSASRLCRLWLWANWLKVHNTPLPLTRWKAYPIFETLLQVLDDGCWLTGKGRKVISSNTIIIMTSNLGATSLRDEKDGWFWARDARFDHESMKRMLKKVNVRNLFPNSGLDEKRCFFHSLTTKICRKW